MRNTFSTRIRITVRPCNKLYLSNLRVLFIGENHQPGKSGFTNPGFVPCSPTSLNPDIITSFPNIDSSVSIDSPASTDCPAGYVNVALTRDAGVEPTKMEEQTQNTSDSRVSFLCALDNHEPVLDDGEVQV